MDFLSNLLLWLLCIVVCAFAAKQQFKTFMRVIKRMRWLFLSIFIIYAFGTPGEYVRQIPLGLAPTYEGCNLGLLQIAKLLVALAALHIMFATSSKESLMAGLSMFLSPLKVLGFNVDRFAARLLLTLEYVEELAVGKNFQLSFHQLDDIYLANGNMQSEKVVVLQVSPFKLMDKVIITIFITSTLGLIAFRMLS